MVVLSSSPQKKSSSPTLYHFPPRYRIGLRVSTLVKAFSADRNNSVRTSYEGVRLEEKVEDVAAAKTRLDAWISSKINGISRVRVQSSIRAGLVSVNGRVIDKVILLAGCSISPYSLFG